MRAIVRDTMHLYVRHLPALLVFFLAGWAANYLLIRFAGFVANFDPLYGELVLPLAVLARIASYVAMFLVLRPGKPFLDALGTSILPFLVVFSTWGMLRDDWVAYSLAKLEQRANTDVPLFLELTPITIAVAVVAFTLRFLLGRYRDRLPRWFGFIAAYLEAVWLFVAVDVVAQLVGLVTGWVQTRRVFVWYNDVVEIAREAFAPVGWIADALGWIAVQAGTVIGLPLAWLTLAGIAYAVTATTTKGTRHAALVAAERRWRRLPTGLRRRVAEVGSDLGGRWVPISTSIRLLWAGGGIAIGVFILAYAILDTSTLWLRFGVDRLIGPHELAWWFASDALIGLGIDAVVEPLRISLIAAAWAFFLLRSAAGREQLQSEEQELGLSVPVRES